MTVPRIRFTFWKAIFLFIMAAGVYCTFLRFFRGLGASTNLSDQFPWGLWIGFDVMCGVMLAAGGFTLTAAVEIFNIKRFHSIVRPTILTAFLGYLLVCAALMYDLGLPWNIWHPLIMRNPHSVMFEVAYCVMFYTAVLAMEFSPIVLEHFKLKRALKVIRSLMVVFVILGVLLSTLHQSSLGTLYLIMPNKLHTFWYSPLLPVFFFLSAIAVGLAMTIFESSMSSKYFGRELELPILRDLGRVLVVVLALYGILKFEDLYHRGALGLVMVPGYEQRFFLLEMFLSIFAPLGLLLVPKIRESAQGLYLAAVLTLLGFVTNRLNVTITGVENAVGGRYAPKWTEVVITAMFVALGFAIFGLAAKYLPIFPEEKVHIPALHEPEARFAEVAVPVHAGD
ncbi:MAG: NrfD/PsrC family molybdoenzyme membrane anchor subunit [Candidatus Korobacteraceae bacterium]|jgi:Ni/Fe-hydrogenase subunit HybB-like protein